MRKDEHFTAFAQILQHVEVTNNALVAHLAGLKHLLDSHTFHALSAMVIARSIAEVAASCIWMINPAGTSNERLARGYAAIFFALNSGLSSSRSETQERLRAYQERLIDQLEQPGLQTKVLRRVKEGVEQEDVAQVQVGEGPSRGRARVAFSYSQRVKDEIPGVSRLYSALSSAAHGEHATIATSWDTPDTFARVIGHVAANATEAWSDAVHAWFGAKAGPFLNESDRRNLLRSMPESTRAAAAKKFAAAKRA